MFINYKKKPLETIFSILRYMRKAPGQAKEQPEQKRICRDAQTSHRLVYHRNGDMFVFFGACIKLEPHDLDEFEHLFNESVRNGICRAVIDGNGQFKFKEEDMSLEDAEYVFITDDYYFDEGNKEDLQPRSVLIEMV